MRRVWRWLMVVGLLAGLAPLLPVAVTVADNAVVAAPCDPSDFDAAMDTVQMNGGGTITFDCGVPTSIFISKTYTIMTGNNVVIDGGGTIVLNGNDQRRHFWIENGASLELRGITLERGRRSGEGGGSIRNSEGGTLTIIDSQIRINRTSSSGASGGAIVNAGGSTATIINSTVAGNRTSNSTGGAIRNVGAGTTLTIQDSIISGNRTTSGSRDGGAIVVGSGAALTVQRSTFLNNRAGDEGGAIQVAGAGTMVTIEDSTFEGNRADTDEGGAIDINGGTLTIHRSTFINNRADDQGGAFEVQGGVVNVYNSTFSGNYIDGTSSSDRGGAFFVIGGALNLINTTVTNNSSHASGGGIRRTGGTVTLESTIVAGNSPDDCSGTVVSNDYNLDGDGSCGLSGPNDLSNTPAALAPLGDYGGPTLTHHPYNGSAAIDSATCVTATDQRGVPRPQGPDCDRGSVEVIPPVELATLCVNFSTGEVTSPINGQCGGGLWQVSLPSPWPLTFCVFGFTGEITMAISGGCAAGRIPHVVPDDGPLLACWSQYTGGLRAVTDVLSCTAAETPAVIPAGV